MKTKLSTLISSKLAFRLLALTFTTLTLTFTACSNDDEDDILGQGEGKQLAQPVAVDFSAGITTRVTTNSEWEIGDLVGISASEIVGTTSTPKYTNVQYKADTDGESTTFSWAGTEQDEIAYTSENKMVFTAYYPHTATIENSIIEASTNTEAPQKNIDFLFAKTGEISYIEGSESPQINLEFQHRMARIRVKIKVTDNTDINGKNIILGGLIHEGTFDTNSGIARANGSNVVNDWSIGTFNSTNGTEMETIRIIYPQNAESLDLRIGDENDNLKTSFTLPDNKKFEPNNSYTINAEVKDATIHATITIDNNTIKGWNENEPGKTKIAFISNAEDTGSFDAEAGAAYNWLVNTDKYDVEYLSMNDVNENIDLSSYKMIWTHFDFENLNENCQMNQAIKQYYANGGAVFASREAMLSLGIWGIIPAEYSNLTWKFESGDNEQTENPNLTIKDTDHPIFVEFNNPIYSGTYTIKRKFRGWNTQDIGLNTWTSATKANVLAGDINNQNVVSIAEISKETGLQHGCAIVIGDPYFFWQGTDLSTSASLYKLTENTIDYLISQSNNK
ncbi:fimbrillin family protein [Bacteroides clarus]|uniref:fimbrillin family protein n=1 Tax=Bacteroides clarus TaxID=626929 RepID=UPI002A7F6CDB|nr:fimbrillin family protein [Bacteroides clarus]